MEIVIEAKKFIFSSLVRSVAFRVVEVGRRLQQTVDLKLQEATWLISTLRLICSEGFCTGRWMTRYFSGRAFSVICKSNKPGPFIQFDIFGAKKRLKTLFIPSGEGSACLKNFADTLALTTVGPERQLPVTRAHPPPHLVAGNIVTERSFSEVVNGGNKTSLEGAINGKASELRRISIWGLDSKNWSLEILQRLKAAVPGVKFIVHVISSTTNLLALFSGPLGDIPRAVSILIGETVIRVFLDTKLPERMARIFGGLNGEEGRPFYGKKQS